MAGSRVFGLHLASFSTTTNSANSRNWKERGDFLLSSENPSGNYRVMKHLTLIFLTMIGNALAAGTDGFVPLFNGRDLSAPIAAPGVPFLRGIEVQVLDHGYATQYEKQTGKKPDWFTTHGDVFPIHGASTVIAVFRWRTAANHRRSGIIIALSARTALSASA
jgi:hypothetical protein